MLPSFGNTQIIWCFPYIEEPKITDSIWDRAAPEECRVWTEWRETIPQLWFMDQRRNICSDISLLLSKIIQAGLCFTFWSMVLSQLDKIEQTTCLLSESQHQRCLLSFTMNQSYTMQLYVWHRQQWRNSMRPLEYIFILHASFSELIAFTISVVSYVRCYFLKTVLRI